MEEFLKTMTVLSENCGLNLITELNGADGGYVKGRYGSSFGKGLRWHEVDVDECFCSVLISICATINVNFERKGKKGWK